MQPDVRRPLLRGSQLVRALWFDCALLGEDEARRRLLAAWETGARAHRVEEGYLLVWKAARRLLCEGAPGLPLCEQDGVLASAPLLAAERAGVASGSAVLVRGASLHVHPLDAGTGIDPSCWLDLSALPVCVALAMPSAPQADFVAAAPQAAPDVRSLLGAAVPPPSPERTAFLRAAAGGARRGRRDAAAVAVAAAVAGSAIGAAGLLAGVARLSLSLLARIPGREGTVGGAGAQVRPGSPLGDWLAARAARLAAATRIAGLLGWRQANYLRKMLRQFEEGDFDEALRHAIPLDSPDAPTRLAFGVGRRRAKLEISGATSGAGIGLDADSAQILRATYQRSFEMLDRAGRIDEAVFVLAELLNRRQEAVDYLERKGRVAQAAGLAETLNLGPATAVRLHLLAGDTARAVLLARLNGCFAEAVAELERRRKPEAAALRLEWALDLAARGSLDEAALAVWPLEQERPRALAWLREAEQGGGTLGTQALLHLLVLDPDTLRARGASIQALLSAQGAEAVRQRVRACECLLRLDTHSDGTRRMAAALWRVLAAERSAGLYAMPGERLGRLLKLTADPVLAGDLPRKGWTDLPAPAPLAARKETLHVHFAERGLHPLEDVRALPDGGHLLALGEGGVVLAYEGARAPLRFPVPAQHLVVSDNGRRALALTRREKAVRVSRIDLTSGKVEDWFSADLRFWAAEYDGAIWSVVADERLMVLDATAQGRSVLWQVGELPGPVIGFERQGGHEALLLRTGDTVEQWCYALPARRLLGRRQVVLPPHAFAVLPDCAEETPVLLGSAGPLREGQASLLVLSEDDHDLRIDWPHAGLPQASLHDGLLMLRFEADDGWHCRLMNFDCVIVADIVLPDALEPGAALRGGHLLAWDRRGRAVDVDIETAAARTLTFG